MISVTQSASEKKSEIVSAIILTQNRLELLKRAIGSVFAQTYPEIECIVVDNASTDGTKEYCQSLDGIKYIYCRPPKEAGNGCNYARNLGIKASSGSLIALLDDDDYWLPTKIEKQVALMKEKDCGVVYCGTTLEIVEPNSIRYEEQPVNHEEEGDMSKRILMKPFGKTSQLLIKKQLLEEVGYFDERVDFWQEYELLVRLFQLTPVYAVDECLLGYRVGESDDHQQFNKWAGWKKSMRYIYSKHDALVQKLNNAEKSQIKVLIRRDAYHRAKRAHKYGWVAYYYIVYRIPEIVRGLFHGS